MISFIFLPFVFGENCVRLDGRDYTGEQSVTKTGKTCQRWDQNYPHEPRHGWDYNHNYCRNPDNDQSGPWCYTIRVAITIFGFLKRIFGLIRS